MSFPLVVQLVTVLVLVLESYEQAVLGLMLQTVPCAFPLEAEGVQLFCPVVVELAVPLYEQLVFVITPPTSVPLASTVHDPELTVTVDVPP